MTSKDCVYCAHPIKNSDVFFELKCKKHLAHHTHGTTQCRVCSAVASPVVNAPVIQSEPQAVASNVASTSSVSQTELAARARRLANNAARRTEPLKPYEPSWIAGVMGSVLRVAGRVAESSVPDDESSDPVALLDSRVPLPIVVSKHGFDITELINDHGVTIADFFRNGYSISDMCNAFGSRMNKTEGMRVLHYLGMTDEYLTKLPQLSQVPIMQSALGFNAQSLIDDLGYTFRPGAWTIPQMIEVGLTMSVVMNQGMNTWDEWTELRATARNQSDLIRFGVTPNLEVQLVKPVAVPVAAPIAVPIAGDVNHVWSPPQTSAIPSAPLQTAQPVPQRLWLPTSAILAATDPFGALPTVSAQLPPVTYPPAPIAKPNTAPKLVDKPRIPLVLPTQSQPVKFSVM